MLSATLMKACQGLVLKQILSSMLGFASQHGAWLKLPGRPGIYVA